MLRLQRSICSNQQTFHQMKTQLLMQQEGLT